MQNEIPPMAWAIIEAVCQEHQIEPSDLIAFEGQGPRHISRARHDCWRLLRQQFDDQGREIFTLSRIADWFGVRHSAVCHVVGLASRRGLTVRS